MSKWKRFLEGYREVMRVVAGGVGVPSAKTVGEFFACLTLSVITLAGVFAFVAGLFVFVVMIGDAIA